MVGNVFVGKPINKELGKSSASVKTSIDISIISLVSSCSIIVFFTDGNNTLIKKSRKKK